jgi:hypothetical protein
MISNVTFVTSYIKIYEDDYDITKTFQKRLELFLKLADTGINICIFVSPEFQEIFTEICEKYENIKLIDICSKDELRFSNTYFPQADSCELPNKRSNIKDTKNYMYLMNSKIDFVKKVIDKNPFSTDYFSWFDFSLPYIFKNVDKSIQEIKKISQRNYRHHFLTIPGCWDYTINDINYIKNNICWRFCGGFFMGDKNSLIDFYNLSIHNFAKFLSTSKTVLWEVNYWAWLESNTYFKPLWYSGDHNDSIINIPDHLYSMKIMDYINPSDVSIYRYPIINTNDHFLPSSASYVYDIINNDHIINTRYINYIYKDNWDCVFYNDKRQIKSVNISSMLNQDFMPISFNFVEIEDTSLISDDDSYSIGLEDIRLYYQNNSIKFIASNKNYVPSDKIRMIVGDYNNISCSNCKIVNMPWESNCEKNWCPIQYNNDDKQLFIYKWSPFQIGYVNNENTFELCLEKQFNDEKFNRFRGSSCFIERDENTLIGLVHYSVPNVPPVYYHSIVLIDKKTLLPISYSDPFKFGKKPIEFCIGFNIHLDKYLFWISQMDREPLLLKIDIDKIPILNELNV